MELTSCQQTIIELLRRTPWISVGELFLAGVASDCWGIDYVFAMVESLDVNRQINSRMNAAKSCREFAVPGFYSV